MMGENATVYQYDNEKYVEAKRDIIFTITDQAIQPMIRAQEKKYFETGDPDEKERELQRLKVLSNYKNYVKMLNVSRFVKKLMAVDNTNFDADITYLNSKSGIYRLHDHQLLKHDPKFHVTKILPVEINMDARCPETLKLLEHMFPDEATREYVLELVASSLFRKRYDENIFFIWGKNANNGKTTIMQAFARTLGTGIDGYAVWLDPKTFTVKRMSNATQPDLFLAKNRCLAIIDEPDKGEMDTSAIKNASNTGLMSIRMLYQASEQLQWTTTIIHLCNRLPIMDTKDMGTARRIIVIPVDTQITREMKTAPRCYEKGRNEKYGDYLAINEGPGILAMLLQALKRFQERGYKLPDPSTEIVEETERYIRKHNAVLEYVITKCTTAPPRDKPEEKPFVPAKTFNEELQTYCREELHQDKVMHSSTIIEVMESLGYKCGNIKDARTGTKPDGNRNTVWAYDGVRYKTSAELQLEEMGVDFIDQQKKVKLIKDIIKEIGDNIRFPDGISLDHAAPKSRVIWALSTKYGSEFSDIDKVIKKLLEIGELMQHVTEADSYLSLT